MKPSGGLVDHCGGQKTPPKVAVWLWSADAGEEYSSNSLNKLSTQAQEKANHKHAQT